MLIHTNPFIDRQLYSVLIHINIEKATLDEAVFELRDHPLSSPPFHVSKCLRCLQQIPNPFPRHSYHDLQLPEDLNSKNYSTLFPSRIKMFFLVEYMH